MKFCKMLAVTSVFALAAGAAQAATPSATTWQGTLWITAVSQGCASQNWQANEFHESVYRPYIANSTANLNPDGLSVVTGRAAFLFSPAKGKTLNSPSTPIGYVGTAVGGRASSSTWPATGDTAAQAKLSITTANATFNGVSEIVYAISGTIADFNNINNNSPGCIVTVKGVYTKRPD